MKRQQAIGALKGLVAACAIALTGAAQAAYIKPGISINGVVPSKDGTYTGYTYQNGVFTLTSAGSTYTFAGEDTSGKVRIEAAANCTIDLQEGFKLDLRNTDIVLPQPAETSPISISGSKTVTVNGSGKAYLYGGQRGAGIRVVGGQTLYVTGLRIYAYGGDSGAGIGSGYWETTGCGTIYLRGLVHAEGGYAACGIGLGSNSTGDGAIIVDRGTASVGAVGAYPAAGIGTSDNATGTMMINISAGIVSAVQRGGYGAAIGTGQAASGTCRINISCGTVIANVYGESGAGIGSGHAATGTTTVNISGGNVTANGGGGSAGIGGGEGSTTPSVTISGGTVVAKGDPDSLSANDIGAGKNGKGSAKAVVTGGSVVLSGGKGALYPSSSSSKPLNCITVGNLGGSGRYVDVSLTTSQGTYGSKDIQTGYGGYIYLWVPPAKYDNLVVDGKRYKVDVTSGDAVATPYVDQGGGGGEPTEPVYDPPANDNFAKAITISGSSGIVSGTTVGATIEDGLTLIVGSHTYNGDDSHSVWYSWTAPFSGKVYFRVESPLVDGGYLGVDSYTGTASQLQYAPKESSWVCSAEDDGFDGAFSSFTCTKGVTYKIKVYNVEGVFTLSWDDAEKVESFKVSCNSRDGTAKIIGYEGSGGAVNIPSSIFNYQVTAVDEGVFKDESRITSVTISEGITTIGTEAFRNCISLETVTLPDSVVSIGERVFLASTSLTSVNIPNAVTIIPAGAFVYTGLTSITIPAGVVSIEYDAFASCSALKAVTYLGSCPEVGAGIYGSTPSDLVSYVPAGNSTWSEALAAGTWQGRAIKTGTAAKTYTVQFHKYDGSGATAEQRFKVGETKSLLWMDSQLHWMRDGYEFVGWVPWNPDSKPRVCKYVNGQKVKDLAKEGETVHLWCGWKSSSSYRVCFNKNDGSGTKLNQVILRNKEDTLAWLDSQLEWTRPGYTFKGWAETATGAVKYANGAKVKNLAMNGGTKNLYAVWAGKKYTVQYHKYDGSGATKEQTMTMGKAQRLLWMDSQLGWMRDGYEFVGWVPWNPDSKARVCKYANGESVKDIAVSGGVFSETVHLWCGWKSSSSYRVCFNKNDGSGTKLNQVILRNKEANLAWLDSLLEWTREGYSFQGWAETASGAVKYANGAKVKNLAMNGGTKNLYAIWKATKSVAKYAAAGAQDDGAADCGVCLVPDGVPVIEGELADGSGVFCLVMGEDGAVLYLGDGEGWAEERCEAAPDGDEVVITIAGEVAYRITFTADLPLLL